MLIQHMQFGHGINKGVGCPPNKNSFHIDGAFTFHHPSMNGDEKALSCKERLENLCPAPAAVSPLTPGGRNFDMHSNSALLPCIPNFINEEDCSNRRDDTENETNLVCEVQSPSVDTVVNRAASVLLLMRFSTTVDGRNAMVPSVKNPSPIRAPVLVQKSCSSVNSLKSSIRKCLPRSLYMAEDRQELNSLHCFVRSQLLEVFQLPPKVNNNCVSQPGRVGLRCVFCSHLPRKLRLGTTMCTFYPKSLSDLYRCVCTWQRVHFQTCKYVPRDVAETYHKLKQSDRSRGKTTYWVTSAIRLGLADIDDERSGIYFAPSSDERIA